MSDTQRDILAQYYGFANYQEARWHYRQAIDEAIKLFDDPEFIHAMKFLANHALTGRDYEELLKMKRELDERPQ